MVGIVDIIGKFEDSEETQMFEFAGMLADPLTRKIMAKLASPRSPISADSIPTVILESDKVSIISRLSRLEKNGILRSEKVKAENGYCKKYFINDSGKKLVSKYMTQELKNFQ